MTKLELAMWCAMSLTGLPEADLSDVILRETIWPEGHDQGTYVEWGSKWYIYANNWPRLVRQMTFHLQRKAGVMKNNRMAISAERRSGQCEEF